MMIPPAANSKIKNDIENPHKKQKRELKDLQKLSLFAREHAFYLGNIGYTTTATNSQKTGSVKFKR